MENEHFSALRFINDIADTFFSVDIFDRSGQKIYTLRFEGVEWGESKVVLDWGAQNELMIDKINFTYDTISIEETNQCLDSSIVRHANKPTNPWELSESSSVNSVEPGSQKS